MYESLTGLPTNGRLFCSNMMLRALKGRHRSAIPARAATCSARFTAKYVYVLPRNRKKSRCFCMVIGPKRVDRPVVRGRNVRGEAQVAGSAFVASTQVSGHAFKRRQRIDLDRPWMSFGLDGVAFRRQLCAVPADNTALP